MTNKAQATLPTKYGNFSIEVYVAEKQEHAVLTIGDISKQPTLTRIHSQCFTGDTIFSMRCDCGEQLAESMKIISENGSGILLYLTQEGRGIGLVNKIKAYALQENGLDTVEANHALGFDSDERNYKIAAEILMDLGISNIQLLTNNPDKITQLIKYGLRVNKRIPLEIEPNEFNKTYLATKKSKLGHLLKIV